MEFYMKQNTLQDSILFMINDRLGQPVFKVKGDLSSLSGKMYLLDFDDRSLAKISRIGPSALSKYRIYVKEKEQLSLIQSLAGTRPIIKILGKNWKLRGEIYTRSFDLIDVDGSVIMSHGRCFSCCGECFGIQIMRETEMELCLAVATVIDSIIINGYGVVQTVSS